MTLVERSLCVDCPCFCSFFQPNRHAHSINQNLLEALEVVPGDRPSAVVDRDLDAGQILGNVLQEAHEKV